jgi:hypothetical protein
LFILSSPGCDPLSFGVFLPPPLLQAFPLLVAGHVLPLLPSLGQIVYLQFHEGLPLPRFGAQDALPSLLCVFFVTVAYYSVFFFFPWVESVCPGGYADLAQGCLWDMMFSSSIHLPANFILLYG